MDKVVESSSHHSKVAITGGRNSLIERDKNSSINSFHFSSGGNSQADKESNRGSINAPSQYSGLSALKSVSTFKEMRSGKSSNSKGTKYKSSKKG
jgi:hypothetical protein